MARKLTYHQGDRLFEPMNDLTIILAAIGHALHQLTGTIPKEPGVMRMRPKVFDYGIAIPLKGPLEVAFRGELPSFIDIGLVTIANATAPLVGDTKETTGFGGVMTHIVQPVFLGFFERYNVWLTDQLGDAVSWPATLNFARVVRNAIAHGKIYIRDPRSPPVSWKGLTIGHPDNGQRIIRMGTGYLGPTDVIGLMIEADEELTKIGVPIL